MLRNPASGRIAGPRSRAAIAELIPHAGASVLLDAVEHWDEAEIVVTARSHLEAENPLRRAGRLDAVCGVEYALQAAALHGALLGGGDAQPAGFLASTRNVSLATASLDDPRHHTLRITARSRHTGANGMIYDFTVSAEGGFELLSGTATVAFPRGGV